MDAKSPAIAHLLCCVRQHDVAWGIARRLAHPFGDEKQRRHRPVSRQGEQWHCCHLDDVAENRDGPVLTGLIAQTSRNETQAIAEQFAKTGDDANCSGAGPQDAQIWSNNAARPFISKVREEAHNADQQHKLERDRGGKRLTCLFHDYFLTMPIDGYVISLWRVQTNASTTALILSFPPASFASRIRLSQAS